MPFCIFSPKGVKQIGGPTPSNPRGVCLIGGGVFCMSVTDREQQDARTEQAEEQETRVNKAFAVSAAL